MDLYEDFTFIHNQLPHLITLPSLIHGLWVVNRDDVVELCSCQNGDNLAWLVLVLIVGSSMMPGLM